jgi:glutamine amidotransferase
MCRLYGLHANEPTKVECSLVYAQNALMMQSRADLRGSSHSDGWGIGFYENSLPTIERRELAAYRDLFFSATAERVYSKTVVAHVRNATVGRASLANTHPFTHHRWTFAHNGTVRPIGELRPRLEEETEPSLLDQRRGDTDSELAFLWLLSRMSEARICLDGERAEPEQVAEVLAEAVRLLDERSVAAGAERPAMLNFLLTDGVSLVASRWHRTLHWLDRVGVHDCEICGIPHIHHDSERHYRAVVVASEPITRESWQEVPDHSVLVVDQGVRAEIRAI